ncbi:hypothetical protein BDZ91DRAFT_709289 [Kalaharituber pfeilii]|nr:hypothetical protein BDZ91DRAFT_709289 [Kalaharituber pfeilii]
MSTWHRAHPSPSPSSSSISSGIREIPPLNALLSPEHRAELAISVASLCDRMRTNLCSTFDDETSLPTPSRSNPVVNHYHSSGARPDAHASPRSTQPSPLAEGKADDIGPGKLKRTESTWFEEDEGAKEAAADSEAKRRELELRRRQARDRIRAACLESFDAWKDKLLARVFEVVNSREVQNNASTPLPSGNLIDLGEDAPKEVELETLTPSEIEDLAVLQSLYPPILPPSTLLNLPLSTRRKILHSLLLVLISLENYDARSRVLLHFISSSLSLPPSTLITQESQTAQTLIRAVSGDAHLTADTESQKRIEQNKIAKRWKVGLASVAGAAVIGLTGGLAAPLVAAGIGGLLSGIGLGVTAGYLGAVAGSGAIVGALFGAYGGKMTGEMVERYAVEVEDFAFIPLQQHKEGEAGSRRPPAKTFDEIAVVGPPPPDKKLMVTIGISGWLARSEDIVRPWRCLSPKPSSIYALRWDPSALLDLGTSLDTLLESYTWKYVQYEIIKRTVLATLYMALWPLVLVKAARVIDNPYSVARHRAEKAGRVLADALINRVQGLRPVNLLGFGLGARVLYYCMLEMARRGTVAYGVVQDVYFFGAPVPSGAKRQWTAIRAVAAGRVVVGYSGSDWVLGFLERGSSLGVGIAGLQGVEGGVKGIENVDLGKGKEGEKIVEGHTKYTEVMGVVLKECGVGALGELVWGEVESEGAKLRKVREKERLEREEVEREEREKEQQKQKEKEGKVPWEEGRSLNVGEAQSRGELEENVTTKVPAPGVSSENRKIGDWEEQTDRIDEVVDRIEKDLAERRRRRAAAPWR